MLKSILSGFQGCCWRYVYIFIRFAVVASESEISEIPRNSPEIRTYSSSKSSKVIDLGVNRKLIILCHFLLISNSDPPLFDAPWRRNALYDMNVIYTPLYSTLGYNSVADITDLHSSSCCCLPKSRNHAKFRQNLTLQQFKVIQGHRSWCQSKAHMRLPINH